MSAWDRFWFRPASPLGLIATRLVLCVTSIWILASRPDLPEVLRWPREMWAGVRPATRIRYFMFDVPFAVERVLWVLLFVALAASLAGIRPRVSCLAASLLLYHFAPLENVLFTRLGPYFNGLTLPVLGLAILSFARTPRMDDEPSPDFRWPLAMIQILFAFNYAWSAVAKMQSAGLVWISAANLREGIILGLTYEQTSRPLARLVIQSDVACFLIAATAFSVDLLFLVVPFRPRLARILIPIALLGHLGIALAAGILFLSLPYLLIYLDWDWVAERMRERMARKRTRAEAGLTST